MNSRNQGAESTNVLILGAGLTGLSAAYHLREECLVAESSYRPGGTAGSISHGRFHLDRGVHILYFRDPWTLEFVTRDLGVSLVKKERQAAVWFHDRLIPYPIQFNLSSIPIQPRLQMGASCFKAICQNLAFNNDELPDLKTWAIRNFGKRLTDEFFIPYNEKLWGIPPHDLTTEWMEGYVPGPNARSIVRGMMPGLSRQYGSNSTFWYPETGGISTVSEALAKRVKSIRYGMRPESIDLNRKMVRFQNGDVISYQRLISTIPLVDLVATLTEIEPTLIRTAGGLHSHALTLAHVLIPRTGVGKGRHWIYVPQPEIPFYRITLPHNINASTCPNGWSVLTIEIGGRIGDKTTAGAKYKSALTAMKLLLPSEKDSEVVWDELAHGYVSYDRKIAASRHCILSKLREHDVICLGRYGRWEYSNMESALLQGREIRTRLDLPEPMRTLQHATKTANPGSRISEYFGRRYPKRSSGLSRMLFRRGEVDRLVAIRTLVPYTEGMRILDAGCGDGSFLGRVLHGTPSGIRLEDLAPEPIEIARQKLKYRADTITTDICDSKSSTDTNRYDLVLALGIADYEPDWRALVTGLLARCRGNLIIDFPKTGTAHGLVRQLWLNHHHLRLHTGTKFEIEAVLRSCGIIGAISELRLQWLVQISSNADVYRMLPRS